MKRKQIKKYVIHILAVPAIVPDIIDIPLNQCAFIILTNRTTRLLDDIKDKKLIVDILDVEDRNNPGAFTGAHARYILRFLEHLPEEVTDLYVCCSKGGSRSPGCAAALLLMSGRSDRDVWKNPYYYPNILVFKILCREAGVFMPWLRVMLRKAVNYRAFTIAKKRHNTGKYDRWQILD